MKNYLYLVFVTLLCGCSQELSQKYIKCNEVKYITDFPKEINASDPIRIDADLRGCVNFLLADSFFVLSNSGDYLWHLIPVNNPKNFIPAIRTGHGQNELVYAPTSIVFVKDSLGARLEFFDSDKSRLLSMPLDIKKDEKPGFNVAYQIDDNVRKNFSDVYSLPDSSYFGIEFVGFNMYRRNLFKNGKWSQIKGTGNLDSIKTNEDINVIGSVICLNRTKSIVAEAMICLNQINLYSLKEEKSLTLCVGKEMMNVEAVEKAGRSKRPVSFNKIVAKDNYFAALYIGTDSKSYELNNGKSEIMIFDWEGNPKLKIKIPYIVTSFDISSDGKLYVFSCEGKEETLAFYKITELKDIL